VDGVDFGANFGDDSGNIAARDVWEWDGNAR